MTLTVLEMLYITLIAFVAIIGTLLTIILVKVIKILGPVTEIVDIYNRGKKIFDIYASIPSIVMDWFKEIIDSVFHSKKL